MTRDIWVIGATRTPVGRLGGALRDVPLSALASCVVRSVVQRSQIDPQQVDHVVLGNVIPTEPRDTYLARVAALSAGIPASTPAFNVNRLCGSGLQAIVSASQMIDSGECKMVVAGGAESMSRGPRLLPITRGGGRLSAESVIDMVDGIFRDPMLDAHVGITAEHIARVHGITREAQDELAFESQVKARHAIQSGRFKSQITAVSSSATLTSSPAFSVDEHPRANASMRALSRLPPVFEPGGTVTAGNCSGINDGAAALVLADAAFATERGYKPMARLVAHATVAVDPMLMGLSPVDATRLVLQRAGLKLNDIDVIELNEAFAAQVCAVTKLLDLDPARCNPNGSAISLGHPVGASGAIIATRAIHELHRTGGRYALAVMCIGGGQGIAAIFESTR